MQICLTLTDKLNKGKLFFHGNLVITLVNFSSGTIVVKTLYLLI